MSELDCFRVIASTRVSPDVLCQKGLLLVKETGWSGYEIEVGPASSECRRKTWTT